MKTRQQRLAEERAGHPPSPPQSLPVNQRAPRRARSKTPSATVAAGSVEHASQSAVLGEPQALLRVWVDAGPEPSGRSVRDPTHQMMFRSTHLPQVVALLNNICNESNETPSSHQGIPQQEMEEPIEPKKPEPVTADKPAKRRRNAFRRNPTMGITARLRASHDTSAVDGIPMIFRDGFDFAANEPGYAITQQRDDKLSADGDCTMNDVSETGNTFGQSADSSIQVTASEVNLAPQTPRPSKWSLGSLYQSARSLTRRLVSSPLGSVPESPESSPQTATTSAPQAVTESTAPTQPKKKSSAPSSARDRRAKSRRHDNSAGRSEGYRRPRAKPAEAASGDTEATGVQDKEFAPINGTHPDIGAEEAQQAGAGEPIGRQNILWPSRSLDRMNANKRKRGGDPIDTPGAEAGSHARGATDRPEDGGNTEEQPGKRRRTGEPGRSTSQVAEHPAVQYQGGNVFAEDKAAREAASTGQQPLPRTPIPITNREGTFKVPSPSDSDWSDSGSEEDEASNAGLGGVAPSRENNGGLAFAGPSKLPKPHQTLRPAEAEALRKARENSQKHKPRKPSGLRHSIKAYPSPPLASKRRSPELSPHFPGDAEKRQPRHQAAAKPFTSANLEPSGHIRKFNAFEDWCKTASPAVTAAIEKMEVDSNMAGKAVEQALENPRPGRATQHTAYKDWCRTAPPAVLAVLEDMEVDSNLAGQAFMSGLDKFTEPK